jgi:hypothetical protein
MFSIGVLLGCGEIFSKLFMAFLFKRLFEISSSICLFLYGVPRGKK